MSTTTAPPPSTTAQLHHFLSIPSLSLPISFPDLSLRLHKNLYTFRPNYLFISLLIFLLTLIPHPLTFNFFLAIILPSFYLLYSETEPLIVFDFEIGHRLVAILLSIVAVGALAATGIWWNVFVSVLISILVVFVHAILRTPDDIEESPYGALLSVIDEDDSARGPYTLV